MHHHDALIIKHAYQFFMSFVCDFASKNLVILQRKIMLACIALETCKFDRTFFATPNLG